MGEGSDHSSERSTRDCAFLSAGTARAARVWSPIRSCSGRGFPCRASSPRRAAVSCTALSPLLRGSPRGAVCSLWHFPSARLARASPACWAGRPALRSPDFPHPLGRDRSLAGTAEEIKFKDPCTAGVRTSCTPPAAEACPHWRPWRCAARAAPRTAAASCGTRRIRHRP